MAAPPLPDRRRVAGPIETFVPETLEHAPATLPAPGKRRGGRADDTLRPIYLTVSVVEQARGSAYVEMGSTKVMCAVYGPRPPLRPRLFSERGTLDCAVTWAPFASATRKLGFKHSDEPALAQTIEQALEDSVRLDAYPKLSVDVYVTVLEDGGSVEAAAITCASAALAHAGILMYDTVVACSAGIADERILMDCESTEETALQGSLLLAFMPSLNETTFMASRGEVDWNTLMAATEMCLDACVRIKRVLDEALVTSVPLPSTQPSS